MRFDRNILNKEPLELWFEKTNHLKSTELDTLELLLNKRNSSTVEKEIVVKDTAFTLAAIIPIFFRNYTVPMKKSHMLNKKKIEEVRRRVSVLKYICDLDRNHEIRIEALNMSYDPKRRKSDSLYQELNIVPYSLEDTHQMIVSAIESISNKEACMHVDWYRDGGRNRKIKCELCCFKSQCKFFNEKKEALNSLLSI